MNIIKRGKVFGHDWYIRVGKRIKVDGVNSDLGNGESVLFWEFDGKALTEVRGALAHAQEIYELPDIYILQASINTSWHAVCLARLPWLQALGIVIDTDLVDADYIRLAAYREHFTLRLSDKGHGRPVCTYTLASEVEPGARLEDLRSGVQYGAWIRADVYYA